MSSTTGRHADAAPAGNPPIRHPGPREAARSRCIATGIVELEVPFVPGRSVESCVAEAVASAGCRSGWVEIADLVCDPFRFVIPAPSSRPGYVASYSRVHAPDGPVRVTRAGISAGIWEDSAFTHCHGLWSGSADMAAMGHMLARDCLVAAPATGRAVAFSDAYLDRRYDPETGFDLFAPRGDGTGAPADALLLQLRPNADLGFTIAAACAAHEIPAARIYGLGSLNGACFIDGARMDSSLTEFLVTEGVVEAGELPRLSLSAVDHQGKLHAGTVIAGGAPVSVTAELVIRRESLA